MSSFEEAVGTITLDARHYAMGDPTAREIVFATVRWVHGHISHGKYGLLSAAGEQGLPQWANETIGKCAGICGGQARACCVLLSAFGVRSRILQVRYAAGTHVLIEAFWDDAWHLFDPTWAAWFRKCARLLSWEELLAQNWRRRWLIWDGRIAGLQYERLGGDPFGYLSPTSWAYGQEFK